MTPQGAVLVVEDEPSLQLALADLLAEAGFTVKVVGSLAEAQACLSGRAWDVVLSDMRLPDGDGLAVLAHANTVTDPPAVVFLTAYGTVERAVEAMKKGAADFLSKPFDDDHLLAVMRRNAEFTRLRRRVAELERAEEQPVGVSPAFTAALELATTVAPTDVAVLLQGETGTGKEVVARCIHRRSLRAFGPFVAVNCAAIPESLLEAELFGHERGAFTGALRSRAGRFEEASGGTLFLDEVGEMSLPVQAKLLRVLQDQKLERLGSNRTVSVDVRIVAATQKDLAQEVAKGTFRQDLYYRLKVVPIVLPPLRQRQEDIPLLAAHFARSFAQKYQRTLELSPELLAVLAKLPWPGNVRELLHLIERLAVTCPAPVVRPEHLPPEYCLPTAAGKEPGPGGTLAHQVRQFERRVIAQALEAAGGNRTQAAQSLGISRKTLWEKMRLYGLDDGGFQTEAPKPAGR